MRAWRLREDPQKPPSKLRGDPAWDLGLAVAYVFLQETFFGWHLVPHSGIEVACWGLSLLLLIVTNNRYLDAKTMSTRNDER